MRPAAPAPTTRTRPDARRGSTSTGRATSTGPVDGRGSTTSTSVRAARAAGLHPRPRRPGRTGCRTSPLFMRDHRVHRARPARLRRLGDAGRGRSRSRATRADRRAAATRSGSTEPRVVGNSMGGFIAAEMALALPDAGRSARARLRRAVFWQEHAARAAAGRAGARLADGAAARWKQLDRSIAKRPRLRRAALQPPACATRSCSRPELAYELVAARAASQGFVPGAARRCRLPTSATGCRDRDPDADRVGPQRHARPGRGRRRVRAS